jgi:hypothetical protein
MRQECSVEEGKETVEKDEWATTDEEDVEKDCGHEDRSSFYKSVLLLEKELSHDEFDIRHVDWKERRPLYKLLFRLCTCASESTFISVPILHAAEEDEIRKGKLTQEDMQIIQQTAVGARLLIAMENFAPNGHEGLISRLAVYIEELEEREELEELEEREEEESWEEEKGDGWEEGEGNEGRRTKEEEEEVEEEEAEEEGGGGQTGGSFHIIVCHSPEMCAQTETVFKVKNTTCMQKVFNANAERTRLNPRTLRYTWCGEVVRCDDTVERLGLEDGDRIECCFTEVGDEVSDDGDDGDYDEELEDARARAQDIADAHVDVGVNLDEQIGLDAADIELQMKRTELLQWKPEPTLAYSKVGYNSVQLPAISHPVLWAAISHLYCGAVCTVSQAARRSGV